MRWGSSLPRSLQSPFLASLHPRQALPLSGPLHPGAWRAPGTAPLRSSSWASLINLPQLGQRALFACTAHPCCQNHESLLRKHQKFTLPSARKQQERKLKDEVSDGAGHQQPQESGEDGASITWDRSRGRSLPRQELLKATIIQDNLCSAPGDACSRFYKCRKLPQTHPSDKGSSKPDWALI